MNTTVKLNGVLLSVSEFRRDEVVEDGKPRQRWRFRLSEGLPQAVELVDDLLGERELTLQAEGAETRVRRGAYSMSYSDRSPLHTYSLEFVELFPGEEAPLDGMSEWMRMGFQLAQAGFDLDMQFYEERIRAIESRLGIDNAEWIDRYEKKLDVSAEKGWISRFPEIAQGLNEISRTKAVQRVLDENATDEAEEA